jgi:glutamine amidotransferase
MIYDGELTYIHSNMKESLYYLKNEDEFLVATTPLDDDENWKQVELNKLFGLIDGNIVLKAKNMTMNLYSLKNMKKLWKNF